MSRNEERDLMNDDDAELDEWFGDAPQAQVAEDAGEVALDLEIDEMLRDAPNPDDEIAIDDDSDEELGGPLPAGEEEGRWAIWETETEFNERKLSRLRRSYRTSATITIPGAGGRAHLPPVGQIAISEVIMRCGVFLPLLPYFCRIIEYYRLAPFQLVPNAYRAMVALYVIIFKLGIGEPQPEDFAWFYQIKSCGDFGFFYFSKWADKTLVAVEGIRDNMGPFKKSFFFTPSHIAGNFRTPSNT